jgi:hypothetical protein
LQNTIGQRDMEIKSLKNKIKLVEQDTDAYKKLVDKLSAELNILKKAGAVMSDEKTTEKPSELESELLSKSKAQLVQMCEDLGLEKSSYNTANKAELIKLLISI